jgi:hypothetical protein
MFPKGAQSEFGFYRRTSIRASYVAIGKQTFAFVDAFPSFALVAFLRHLECLTAI